jgi:hypothetical protein
VEAIMAADDDESGFNDFLAFLQCDTTPAKSSDEEKAKQPQTSSQKQQSNKEVKPETVQPKGDQSKINAVEELPLTPPQSKQEDTTQSKDEKADDENGFLNFLSFIYDAPLEPEEEEAKEETSGVAQEQTKAQLPQEEEHEAWLPIETTQNSSAQAQNHNNCDLDIVKTSKNMMKEIIANDEDATKQKNKFVTMELAMLFSLAGSDDMGGADVGTIFRCLKDDAAKRRLVVG